MTEIKQRAVNPAQKTQRIEQILDAVEHRFIDMSYAEVRLVDVAKDVGLTKAAFYRYFRNKELLFLALFLRSLERLFHDIQQNLQVHQAIKAFSLSCDNNRVFCKLSGILYTILEHNITQEEAREFKLAIRSKILIATSNVKPLFGLEQAQAIELFMMAYDVIIGVWVTCNHSKVAKAAIDQTPELSMLNRSFEPTLHKHFSLLMSAYIR